MKNKLTSEEFHILSKLATSHASESLMMLSAYKDLFYKGFIDTDGITSKGQAALEPYRAKRAIFLAAGLGNRLRPITLNTPKPLIRVHGKRLIDGLLDACLAAGIEEIYIVRGYLGEQFDQLLLKYPMIRFLENDRYLQENNISSLMCARPFLQNAYIFEADLLLRNPLLIQPYHFTSNYLGIKKDRTDDWCFITKDGVIQEWKLGGEDCFQEVGISYWNRESGEKLSKQIELTYSTPGGKDKFWDHVPLVDFKEDHHVEVRECHTEDVTEIDTFEELKIIDDSYSV